jgi:RNA polymerase sigma-70 factor (ECF subfamily)
MNSRLSDRTIPYAAPFTTTHWSVVLRAGNPDDASADAALDQLCRLYWAPLYTYVRRAGHSREDAEDLTQAFFARILADRRIGYANPTKGRFRSFLLSSLKHFLVNQWRRSTRIKRGSGAVHLSFNCDREEHLFTREPAVHETPESLFERRWAMRVLEQALEQVRLDYVRAGQDNLFEQLRQVLWAPQMELTYEDIARSLGMTGGAVKVAVHRLRMRFRDRLREVVAQTVAEDAPDSEINEEIEFILKALQPAAPRPGVE